MKGFDKIKHICILIKMLLCIQNYIGFHRNKSIKIEISAMVKDDIINKGGGEETI